MPRLVFSDIANIQMDEIESNPSHYKRLKAVQKGLTELMFSKPMPKIEHREHIVFFGIMARDATRLRLSLLPHIPNLIFKLPASHAPTTSLFLHRDVALAAPASWHDKR